MRVMNEAMHVAYEGELFVQIFERAKSLHPDFSTKVKPIQGECYESYLGISDSDRALIENQVEIIFHVAAYVNFNAPLRKAGYINVRSLDHLFDIAKEMKHLKAFVYVSTAFSPSTETNFIEEKFYHPPLNSRKLLSMLDDLDDAVLDEITPSLMKSYSNRYIFTKLIAEDLFRERASGLPACIFRPSIVLPCYKEPLPGWINNAYSVIAITLGYALGILKVVRANASFRACMVPGDYSTNALILSAYYTSKSWQQDKSWEKFQFDVPIVNYSNCTTKFRITWEIFKIQGIKATEKYPFYDMPPLRFQRIYQKVHKFMDVMVPFSTRELTVSTRNINEIWETLSKKDKKLFYCNLDDINIDDYSDVIVRGVRLYLANDKEETISKARRKLFV
ncbi:fatty acyl-CoA reductase wat-like [Planococcus citri]|uniref:fatty acyl-CoA reductase wat-like n=1 Tax=Planococcus citri TaxID=170843 RepID=UPI0031F7B722